MVTAQLNVRYRKPVPTGTPLVAKGWAGTRKGRVSEARSEIQNLAGEVLAEAELVLVDMLKANSTRSVLRKWVGEYTRMRRKNDRRILSTGITGESCRIVIEEGRGSQAIGRWTHLSRYQMDLQGVVDLQSTGLDKIQISGQQIMVGATTRLDSMMENPNLDAEITRAIRLDASKNIRNMATLGGWLISSDGRSAFSTVLLALDIALTWEPNSVRFVWAIGFRSVKSTPRGTAYRNGMELASELVFDNVARSPKDRPT